MTKKLKLSTVVSLCFIIFSSMYFLQSLTYKYWNTQYAPGAGFLPRWVGGLLLILSIIAVIQSFKQEGIKLSEALPKGKGTVNVIICWIAMLFFAFFAEILGLIITGIIMLATLFSRGMKWHKAFIISVIVTLCCFFIFKILLQVQIPENQFGF